MTRLLRERPPTPAVRIVRWTGGLAACLLLVCGAASARQAAPAAAAEGNPFRGRQLFAEKSCSGCHSVWGHGGAFGPEMSVAVAGKPFYELVGDFWNHTPQMINEGTRLGRPWPTLDTAEMADMLSYLYYLRLFDEPGSAARGRDAYARLQCAACHSLGGRGGHVAVPLDRFGAYPAPTPLAQAMWNAGPQMQQTQVQRGSPIPLFSAHDMADLQAYIRAEGARPTREVVLQPLPSPARGAAIYRNKGCGACHDGARRVGPDLARSALSKTVSEITGLLWNHSYAMGAQMTARGVVFPRFSNAEMSDLIAHLYFKGYVRDVGDPAIGKTVFAKKGCAACHGDTATAPRDLTATLQTLDRAGLASAMWNHAPTMHKTMTQGGVFWPKFEPGEMGHLAAYLRALTRPSGRPAAAAGR